MPVQSCHRVRNSHQPEQQQHPLKRSSVGLGFRKRQSRAVQKGKQKQARPNTGPSSRTVECLSDTQGGLRHPRFSQHGTATELEPWKAYRSLASLRLWWPSGLGCSLCWGQKLRTHARSRVAFFIFIELCLSPHHREQ